MLKGKVSAQIQRGPQLGVPQIEPQFIFRHHPNSWVQTKDGDLIPLLDRLFQIPGVALVDLNGDMASAVAEGDKIGWKVIDQRHCRGADTPDGQDTYLREWSVISSRMRPGATPVSHFTDAWQYPELLPNGAGYRWVRDEAGYLRWIRSLVTKGVIAPPSAELIQAKQSEAERMIVTLGSLGTKAAETEAAEVAARLAALNEAPKAHGQNTAPPAKPGKPGKET